ncbi:MAG TPA: hypothetical protein VHO07_16350 [Streptosporangiaceae bacterium]|nr:hypothetical protein [Streptosporangiaceae bacterium]
MSGIMVDKLGWSLRAFFTPDGADHVRVLAHGLGAVRAGLAAEPAAHRHAEIGEVARCRGVPAPQARDAWLS